MSIPDPYKVLQVDPEAEREVIEAAYRRLARKYHPDVSPDPESQARMVRLNQAWELLRDPDRRAIVDRARLRASGVASRVASSDTHPRSPGGASATREARRADAPAARSAPSARSTDWPISGMRDPNAADSGRPHQERVSRDWTTGRSTTGSTYDAASMGMPQGVGSAGQPPGNPSGSVLNFGRYSGWSLAEIARTDLEYLEWLDRMPIGRSYQNEIDVLLRTAGRRASTEPGATNRRGLFRR